MRSHTASSRPRGTWWWVFSLLIAAPALALALLGFRAIRAEQIERDQQVREQQTQVAHLADAAIANLLERLLAQVNRVADSSAPQSSSGLPDLPVFSLDDEGVLAFPQHRVYFGEFGRQPKSLREVREFPPPLSQLIAQAQAAEAQRHVDEAAILYRRARAEVSLKSWAELGLARLKYQAADPSAMALLADLRWGRSEAMTPTGVPLAILASSYVERYSPHDRARFAPLLQQTLQSLRAGMWWLSDDQRRFYDAQLRRWLVSAGVTATLQDDERIEGLASIERVVRRSLRDGRDTAPSSRFEPSEAGGSLVIWSPRVSDRRTGTVVSGRRLGDLLDAALGPLVKGQPFAAALRDPQGVRIWGRLPDNHAIWRTEALDAVRGWQLAFTGPADVAGRAQSRLRGSATVVLPILVLIVGLAMTIRVVRREVALGRMQSEFLAAVTHEFKSPITSIRLLMERIAGGRLHTAEAAGEYYAAIGRETDRLEHLVSRLLEAQKTQSGGKQYTFVLGSLVEIAEDAVRRLRPRADAKGIHLEAQAEPGIPDVSLDRASIADAVENLVDNAIKYSAPGSHVSVHVRAVDREVHVEVCDQGIGIEKTDLPRVFDAFYRGQRGDLENVHGTGLGLALVKAAAEAHGGTVEVSSATARGSRFTLRLPVAGRT